MYVCVSVYGCIYSCSRTIISRSTTFGFFDEPAAATAATLELARHKRQQGSGRGGGDGGLVRHGYAHRGRRGGGVAIATAAK